MTMVVSWYARIVDAKAAPVSGLRVALEVFNLDVAAWESQQVLATDVAGKLAGRAELAVDALPYAPAIRLVEAGTTAVLASTPQVSRAGRPPVLNVDFGEITRLPAAQRVEPVATAARKLDAGAFTIAGVSSPLTRVGASPATTLGASTVATTAVGATQAKAGISLGVGRDLAAELADSKNVVLERDGQIRKLEDQLGEMAVLRTENARLKASTAEDLARLKTDVTAEVTKAFAAQLAERERMVAERDTALAARAQDAVRLDAELRQANHQVSNLTVELDRLREAAGRGPISSAPQNAPAQAFVVKEFATRLGEELHSAQASLAKSSFSIGRIQVNAKGFLGTSADGTTFEPAGKGGAEGADRLTDVQIEYQPNAADDAKLGIQVPDVAQLTESAARRVLASVGLQLQSSYGPRSLAPDSVPGQAMVQTPRAGETAARGARILVIFAGT